MPAGDSAEPQLPECDFDPEKLTLRVRVSLAADRKSVDPVVEQVMQAVHDMKCANGKEDAIELALQEALANAEIVIQEWIETARELGRPIPEPKGRLLFA